MRAEVQIRRVGLEGQGVGYDSAGNIYFVPGSLPGDVAEVEFTESEKKYRDAELVELKTPSVDRRSPACTAFSRCGGCDWLHWEYPAQLKAKDEILRHVLERAQLKPETFLPIVAADEIYGYRTRVQVRQQGKQVGFLKRRSHDIVDVESCAVAHPKINEALAGLRAAPGTPKLRKVELELGEGGTVHQLVDQPHGAGGFSQIHSAQNDKLRAKVLEKIESRSARRVLELFCGNGNLTFAYLPSIEQVFGVDANEAAITAARARQATNAAFFPLVIDRRLPRKLPAEFRDRYDTLIVDPPRQGVGPDLAYFIHPNLKSILYVSCSPVSFCKDVQCLRKDFRLQEVQGVDMFPHTRHIELVATFCRS